MKSSKGFTLVELVIVIVILGVLAATALPKFADLNQDAEQAAFDYTYGAIKSSISLYHVAWQANGQPTDPFGNYSSKPSLSGYPAGPTISQAFEENCAIIWRDLLQSNTSFIPFISSRGGWGNAVIESDWARNATPIGAFGESSDIYCHFVYTAPYFNGSLSGRGSERLTAIQFNIVSGEIATVEWPFPP